MHCHVEQSAELIDFEQHPDRVSARIKTKTPDDQLHEETSNFDYLIGADGARGVVRKLLGLSFLGETRVVEHLVVGDVTVEGLTEEVSCRTLVVRRSVAHDTPLLVLAYVGRRLDHSVGNSYLLSRLPRANNTS